MGAKGKGGEWREGVGGEENWAPGLFSPPEIKLAAKPLRTL